MFWQVLDQPTENAFAAAASGDTREVAEALREAYQKSIHLKDSVRGVEEAKGHEASRPDTGGADDASDAPPLSHANARDPAGRSMLHLAAFLGDAELARVCVDVGTKLNLRLGDGRTALHVAVCTGSLEVARIIVDAAVAQCRERHPGGEQSSGVCAPCRVCYVCRLWAVFTCSRGIVCVCACVCVCVL